MTNKLSREQVETLLMLLAIGDGCAHGALAGRLGLCSSLADAIDKAARRLGARVVEGEFGFRLSGAGYQELQKRGLLAAFQPRTRVA